jgi:DDE superfamily endonuclease
VDARCARGGRLVARQPGGAQPGAAHPVGRAGALAAHAPVGHERRSGFCPKRTQIVARSTDPPAGATVRCVDELGPVPPRTFPPAPGWSADGHRIKAPLISSRGDDKAWISGALRVCDGQVLTQTAPARNTAGYLGLLDALDRDNPAGDLYLITDHLSSHTSGPIRDWLAAHPRVRQVFIPVGAAWLNLIEGWWRLVRRAAYAGQCFADRAEIAFATRVATGQLNRRAHPWVWGRPPLPPRTLRRRFVYYL